MYNTLVSIIVPVYKVEKYIRTCIESVQAQTYSDWELILVDDGSPDKCGEICDEYASGDSRLTVLHTQNGGLSSARNRALDCPPKGDFVTFLDSDDFWHPDYLKTLMTLAQDNNADIVQCGLTRGTDIVFPKIEENVKVNLYDNHTVFLSGAAEIIMCAKIFKTSLWDGIRMPVGLYNEDDWTMWKLYYHASRIVVTSEKLYYYTYNPTSTMAKFNKKPDLRYFAAYDERIGFFKERDIIDLEHCSRLQFNKSLLLVYSNPQLEKEQRTQVYNRFMDNWKVLKHSPYISLFYKSLFRMFICCPMITSKIAKKTR